MPGFSDYLEQQVLYWLTKTATIPSVQVQFPPAPANLYVSLHNSDPEGTGAGELQASNSNADAYSLGYARKSVPTDPNSGNNANWSALAAGSPSSAQKVINQNQIGFAIAGGAWNQAAGGGGANPARAISYFGLWDALTGGNFLGSGVLAPTITITSGQNVIFNPGQLAIQLD